MKNLIFALSILFSTVGFGQDYIPIFEGYDSVRWNNVFRWHDLGGPNSGAYTKTATIDSSVIDRGKSYRVYQYIDNNGNVDILNSNQLLVREDTLEQKIYAKIAGTFDEYLVYDFSVEVGDNFFLNHFTSNLITSEFNESACAAEVISVKREFIYGKNRKVIELEVHDLGSSFWLCDYKPIWIEGIGTALTFDSFNTWYYNPDEASVKTHCMFKNGEQIVNEGNCNVNINPSAVSNIDLKNNLNISPNPTDNQLVIKNTSSNFLSGKIKIINLAGQILFEKEVNFQSEIRVEEVEKLKTGVYFISLETEEGFIVRKFIKQ